MDASAQTKDSFKHKWKLNPRLAFDTTLDPNSEIQTWILNRNGFSDIDAFRKLLKGKRRILDAGCGNGRISALISTIADTEAEIVSVDINIDTAKENLALIENVECVSVDLDQENLSYLGQFDFIYCQEVLHHLKNPYSSFVSLAKLLDLDGEIAIYVYGMKAPIREFSDEYVRQAISSMAFSEALPSLKGITELGRELRNSDLLITVPDIQVLGIPAGRYKIHEFLYNFFLKCFFNESMSIEENLAIAADWFHPKQASKHTIEEIQGWFASCNLEVTWMKQDAFGITARGKRLK